MRSVACFMIYLVMFATGCASIVSKSDYPVAFNSSPTGANITITDKSGMEIYKGKTPTQITLKSGSGYFSGAKYNVKFDKEGCEEQVLVLEKQLDGWYIGNILFGGLIGFLIVDPATGAMWKLPPNLHASMATKATEIVSDDNNLNMALIDDVPDNLRKEMIKIQ